jgi:hypothetical protein
MMTMQLLLDPRELAFLPPAAALGPEAACWESLHQAYSRWMARTRTYTTQSVGVLHALSCRTWAARQQDGRPA